ncbi:MAG: 5'-nucleotidase/apyrase family protein [Syntrophales bacterium]|nr:5'-nucleotidase/apyrase family protein [Syntrophales bacterium]
MKSKGLICAVSLCLICALSFVTWAEDFSLTVVHVNDTHSHLESDLVNLKVQGKTLKVNVGGFARLKTLVDQWRKEDPNLLFLHAGDVVQGTLYFTLFDGTLEFELLNKLKLSCLVPGNHEFDRGIEVIPRWIKTSKFPWVATNIDFTEEPEIASLVKPYVIVEVNGEKIGIIGLTTEKTPFMALNVGKTRFEDPINATRKYIAALSSQGVNKIIVLSHLGYLRDCELASRVPGVDVIVGGHSHTLLGPKETLAQIGLTPEGPYPTEVTSPDGNKVLVVQAWRWGHVVGKLRIHFSPEGIIKSYWGSVTIPAGNGAKERGYGQLSKKWNEIQKAGVVRIVKEDREVLKKLAPIQEKLKKYKQKVIAWAEVPLERGVNKDLGNVITDAMRAQFPDVHGAIYNSGGVRSDLKAGKITVNDVGEVLPFGNTLVIVELTGRELKEALEGNVDFLVKERGGNPDFLPYVSGLKLEVNLAAPRGERVKNILVKTEKGNYVVSEPLTTYRIVVNSFMAAGGDGFMPLRKVLGIRQDTGVYDRDALIDYLKRKRTVGSSREKRIELSHLSSYRFFTERRYMTAVFNDRLFSR